MLTTEIDERFHHVVFKVQSYFNPFGLAILKELYLKHLFLDALLCHPLFLYGVLFFFSLEATHTSSDGAFRRWIAHVHCFCYIKQ